MYVSHWIRVTYFCTALYRAEEQPRPVSIQSGKPDNLYFKKKNHVESHKEVSEHNVCMLHVIHMHVV